MIVPRIGKIITSNISVLDHAATSICAVTIIFVDVVVIMFGISQYSPEYWILLDIKGQTHFGMLLIVRQKPEFRQSFL